MTRLFETFLDAQDDKPEASLVYSLASPPRLGEFLSELDPGLSLDWSDESFQGMGELRRRVIDRHGYGPACSASDVLVTAGANEANFLALGQLLSAGDEVIVDVPGWPQPLVLAEAAGARVRKLRRHEAAGWAFDLDELDSLVNARTRAIFLCNPNNPTGHVLDEDGLLSVIAAARRVGAFVICDEVYRGLEWNGPETPRVASLYERGISTGSVSKLLGLQGLRIGWMVCQDRAFLRSAMALREQCSEVMSVLGEQVATLALAKERHARVVAATRDFERERLDRLDEAIRGTPGLSWQRPQAGLLGLCRIDLPMGDSDEGAGDRFARRLLAPPYRTLVMSGAAYECPGHIRVGVGGGEAARLPLAIERLRALASELAAEDRVSRASASTAAGQPKGAASGPST